MISTGENSSVEWTVSRCFRLLRPIVSRKSALRSEPLAEVKKRDQESQTAPLFTRHKFGDSPGPRHDPDWVTGKRHKAVTRQYARQAHRVSSAPKSQHSAGAFSIPTPVVARIRGVGATRSEGSLDQNFEHSLGRDIFNEKFVSQSDELNFRSQKLVRGTLDLIEATNTCATLDAQHAFFPEMGPRSLRAMCCRRYARHVVELEDQQETLAAESRFDVATEAYSLLHETFQIGSDDYLRAVSREYGLALFEKMVINSQIPRSHVLALLRRMRNPQHSRLKHASSAEVESITNTLLRSITPDKPCCSRDNTFAHSFNTVAEISSQFDVRGRTSFEFRQFGILARSVLPVCWFGSRRLTALWMSVYHAFMDPGKDFHERLDLVRDVSNFLNTVLSLDCAQEEPKSSKKRLLTSAAIPDYYDSGLGCPKCPKMLPRAKFMNIGPPQQPHAAANSRSSKKHLNMSLNNSFSSIFAILGSFTICATLHPQELPKAEPVPIIRLLGSLSLDILLSPVFDGEISDDSVLERFAIILATTLLVHVLQRPSPGEKQAVHISDLIDGLRAIDRCLRVNAEYGRATVEILPELLYSVSRTSAKLLGNDGFEVLSTLAEFLSSSPILEDISYSKRQFLADLVVSSTRLFAARLGSHEAERLAETLENSWHGQRHCPTRDTPFKATPLPRRDREGLKWEDSIGEWIEAGPTSVDPVIHMLASCRRSVVLPTDRSRSIEQTVNRYHGINLTVSGKPCSDRSSACNQGSRSGDVRDANISSLLLSPSTRESSSPAPIHHIDSRIQSNALQERIALVERTNMAESKSILTFPNQKKTTNRHGPSFSKRCYANSSDIEFDDELSLTWVRKKPRIVDVLGSSKGFQLDEEMDELVYSSDPHCATSNNVKKSRVVSRRNPRGRLLISSRTKVTLGKYCRPTKLKSLDDEIGLEWL
ncbi:hypothetical protein, variant [Verruconis gallopava]|nr:hypothetical protein, variant [Verruconis gallopava]KIW01079.1 hypothetical protein, variant [Verruconis gallopava]